MIQYIDAFNPGFLAHKRVLLRLDLNITRHENGVYDAADAFRLTESRPTLEFLLRSGARVGIISHRAQNLSFRGIVGFLQEILGVRFVFTQDPAEFRDALRHNVCALLDNLRAWSGEEKNDETFARLLASDFDIYVNDAFSVCHREHASVTAITHHLPAYGGFSLQKEVLQLKTALELPPSGRVIIVGGAKPDTKLPVISNLLHSAESIICGGVLGNILAHKRGIIGGVCENIDCDIPDEIIHSGSVHCPVDFVAATRQDEQLMKSGVRDSGHPALRGEVLLDIGPATIKNFEIIIAKANSVIWNGPVGMAETEPFDEGTIHLARSMKNIPHVLIGGGDTVSVFMRKGLIPQQALVSSGGGAMLAFLGGKMMPGLRALGYDDSFHE